MDEYHTQDPELDELADRAAGVFTDWRQSAEALAEIHRRELFVDVYGTFKRFCEERLEFSVKTAYAAMQALDVADEVEDAGIPVPPQTHCRLLWRFDTATRLELARRVAQETLSFRQLVPLALAKAVPPKQGRVRKSRQRDKALWLLTEAINLIRLIDVHEAQLSVASLRNDDRRVLQRKLAGAARRLAEIGSPDGV